MCLDSNPLSFLPRTLKPSRYAEFPHSHPNWIKAAVDSMDSDISTTSEKMQGMIEWMNKTTDKAGLSASDAELYAMITAAVSVIVLLVVTVSLLLSRRKQIRSAV